ncbi:MAG: single-stranded DNA-binding protein [Chloroflexi bacterium]|nr:single-stranded DNA-binding protein [Chloroflexota bacterium]
MSYQKIIIAGSLGKNPEMRYTPSGQAVTNLNVATNRQYKDKSGESVKETTWFRVSVWGKQAESCNQYLRKGSKVLVEGRMNQDPATGNPRVFTGNDGAPRASFEITAQTVRFLSSRSEDASAGQPQQQGNYAPPQDDDIPF